jgi:hypothetical protein
MHTPAPVLDLHDKLSQVFVMLNVLVHAFPNDLLTLLPKLFAPFLVF